MDFALRCAYAHGTQAVRTHLMSGSRAQFELAWCALWLRNIELIAESVFFARRPAFLALRERWRGRIVLQGVALVVLSYFRCAVHDALRVKRSEMRAVQGTRLLARLWRTRLPLLAGYLARRFRAATAAAWLTMMPRRAVLISRYCSTGCLRSPLRAGLTSTFTWTKMGTRKAAGFTPSRWLRCAAPHFVAA